MLFFTVERMRRVAYFSCIEILAYCIMSNHFHVLVYVPAPCELSEEEVLARVQALYTGVRLSDIMKEWCAIVKGGGTSRRKAFLGRYARRMWSTSEFMKTLKQATSQSFNARLKHAGTMWKARFRARELHEISIGLALKELEDDPEAKSADGSHGGDRLSYSTNGTLQPLWNEIRKAAGLVHS